MEQTKKIKTIKISKSTVVYAWGLPYERGNKDSNVEVIEDKMVEHGRWSIIHIMIVRIVDKYYSTCYSVAATESQDESPWDYETEIEFTEVEAKEVLVKTWVPVVG